jgi:tyrosine-specific transport protein
MEGGMSGSKLIGGICLVSGTTIGAGMLLLPTVTGMAGFIPTLFLLLLFWAVMTYTAFLILEVDLWMKPGSNLITMAKNTIGPIGEGICWLVYLFLLYCLTTGYLAGSGPILTDVIQALFGWHVSPFLSAVPLILLFGYFLYEGARWVDYVNRFLILGLVIAYSLMVAFLSQDVEPALLYHRQWINLKNAFPLVATSFGFHIIIPTLTSYMHKNIKELKKVILIGSLIPLIVYIIWEAIALGIIPLDAIKEGYAKGMTGTALLASVLEDPKMGLIAEFFSFFAIITSFIGVTLSLSDFLADGLKIKKNHTGKALLVLLTFLPPIVFIAINPQAFIQALDVAGVFGVIILLVLIPPLMVWQGRYKKGYVSTFQTAGGKMALIFVILFALFAIGLDLYLKVMG